MSTSRYSRNQGTQKSKGDKKNSKKVLVSYIYLDRSQGQTFEQWDKTEGRLLRWSNIVQQLNSLTVEQSLRMVIIKYTDPGKFNIHNMPKKSKWNFPLTLNGKKIIWCKIVVMNLIRVLGFFEENIFYVVLLDENHEFYPTEA